jgi:hypothetical protein
MHPVDSARFGSKLPNGAWALCDSNASLTKPNEFMSGPRFFTIQTTSPKEDRYEQWVKQKGGLRYYVDVFSEREIKQLGCAVGSPLSFVI